MSVENSSDPLLLDIMRRLEGFADEELRAIVHSHVTNQAERDAFDALASNSSLDNLLQLTARTITNHALRVSRLAAVVDCSDKRA